MKQLLDIQTRACRAGMWCLALPFLAALAVTGSGCGEKGRKLPHSADSVTIPYQEFGKTTLFCYDGPFKLWRLDTDYMRKNIGDTAKMLAVPVEITTYDSLGDPQTRILADSGHTSSELESFDIWGNVYVKSADDLVIRSESLWWNKNTRKVGSDDFVQITTPEGDVLRGKGLDANESFTRWSLRESVSGRFPNFRERVEQEDQLESENGSGTE
ncbi:MAG: LPS export ABC transporter periplasmic protein LptC [Chitinivibrionales bacterium]|nr:LPS export ABC transporter periplasmic protein LptC [Chitinivibrionales bacterium]MBD3395352.1 LPS export ABC transporter periplasmic protein LptC [Chitinivibrionales bacterium]